MIWRDTHKIDS